MKKRTYDLSERCEVFAVDIIRYVQSLPDTLVGRHMGGQLLRSGTSPALNYSEATSAASRKDFVHKLRISLKELRETKMNLRIQQRAGLAEGGSQFDHIVSECDELERIFNSSNRTAVANS